MGIKSPVFPNRRYRISFLCHFLPSKSTEARFSVLSSPVVFSNGSARGLRRFGVVRSSVQNGKGKQLGGTALRLHQSGDLRRDSWMLGGQVR